MSTLEFCRSNKKSIIPFRRYLTSVATTIYYDLICFLNRFVSSDLVFPGNSGTNTRILVFNVDILPE